MERGPKPTVEQIYERDTKKCAKCKNIVDRCGFNVITSNGNWTIDSWCKSCRLEYSAKRRKANREKIRLAAGIYRDKNRESLCLKQKVYYQKRSDYIKKYVSGYVKRNQNRYNALSRARSRKRRKADPAYRTLCNTRSRFRHALKNNTKCSSTKELIGCSIEFLLRHLESLWSPGMSWDNYGFGDDKWHIDHIRPCASFDFSDPNQQKECFNWKNLQPLWQTENLQKSSKY